MAFPCMLRLKNECDGCGFCEERGHTLASRKSGAFEDRDDPFYNEEDRIDDNL